MISEDAHLLLPGIFLGGRRNPAGRLFDQPKNRRQSDNGKMD